MRIRRNDHVEGRGPWAAAALLGLGLLLAAGSVAEAQTPSGTLPVRRFQPTAGTFNYWVTERGAVQPHLSPGLGLLVSYAHAPLERVDLGADSDHRVLDYRVNLDLMLAVGLFDRVEIGLHLPLTVAQGDGKMADPDGTSFAEYSAGPGDLRLIPKVRIITLGGFTLGAALPIALPTGVSDAYLGSEVAAFTPKVIADMDFGRFGFGINVGYTIRKQQDVYVNTFDKTSKIVSVDDELEASLGARVGILPHQIDFVLDAYMAASLDDPSSEDVPAELMAGLRFFLKKGFIINVGAGPGLNRGLSTPMFRVFAGLAYTPTIDDKKDTDGDGVLDKQDKCVTEAEDKDSFEDDDGCPDKDNDKDGIDDAIDKCIGEAEDKDGFEDEDGCPETDNDKDGLLDADDKCPNAAEDKDGFEDDDGCPDKDNDKDGVDDANDKCPAEAEDKDNFEDDDGCPDKDNDKDGIDDAKDKCPNEAEVFNGVKDDDGCPDKSKGPVKIEHGKITVPPVFFATNKDKILKKSFKTLELVAKTLNQNTWVKKVRIEGHTDDRGKDAANLKLSDRRAASVKKFLEDKGVSADRLDSKGFGETKPIASNKWRKGRAKNRRVEFIIVDPPMPADDKKADDKKADDKKAK